MDGDKTTVSQSTSAAAYDETRFVVLECAVSLFTILTLYLLVSLLIYEWKQRSLRHFPTRNDRIARYAIALRLQSLLAVSFMLGRLICEHYELLAQYVGVRDDYCDVIIKIKIALSGIAVLGVYIFLWTRQMFCYSDPAMAHLSNRFTRALSWMTLFFLFLAQFIGCILFLTTRFYSITPHGCINSANSIPSDIPWIWVTVATFCFQTMLLFLFVYPLMRHRTRVRSQARPGFRSFLPVIQRATVTATICIVTDLVSSLLILLVNDVMEIIPTLAYDVSLITNVLCVIASFRDWKARLMTSSCCRHTQTSNVKQDEAGAINRSGALSMNSPPTSCQTASIPQRIPTTWNPHPSEARVEETGKENKSHDVQTTC